MTQTEGGWTQGPWEVSVMDNGYGFQVKGKNGKRVIGSIAANGAGIAGKAGHAKANSRLIAAAPELFEALREAAEEVEQLRHYANNHGGMIDDERCDYARAALNKALGK